LFELHAYMHTHARARAHTDTHTRTDTPTHTHTRALSHTRSGSTECLGLFDDDMEAARVFDRHARKHGQMPNFVLDGTRKGFNRRWVAPVADPWFTPMGPALLSSAVTVGMVV